MSARMRDQHWEMTAMKRRKPGSGEQIRIRFDSTETLAVDPSRPPAEITLEATGPSGDPAEWLDDAFWLTLLQAWSGHSLTVRFLPSPQVLLNSVVLHHVHMLRRVAPNWHIVAHTHVHDLAADGALADAAMTPYHEIHLVEAARTAHSARTTALRPEEALARIRRVQVANGRHAPIVICARPQSAPRPVDTARAPLPPSRTPAASAR